MGRIADAIAGPALALVALLLVQPAVAADQITFGTDWRAQAEHGGYYQALAEGLYEAAGLEVTIRQGGPQVNHAQLLAAGRIDIYGAPNSFIPLNFVAQNIPMVAVAAIFQRDPAVLIAHPGQGNDDFRALKGKKIMISPETRVGFWRFLKARFEYDDAQIAPYTFNLAPFLADPKAIQQGLLTSEPFQLERAGQKPVVLLLADSGYASYSSVITTSRKLTEEKPDVVRRFVAASIKGWIDYLNGDPRKADALIKRDNPEMTDDLLAYSRAKMKEHGMLDSPDTKALGVGAMSDIRWRAFFIMMAGSGLYSRDMDYTRAYTEEFLPQGLGR